MTTLPRTTNQKKQVTMSAKMIEAVTAYAIEWGLSFSEASRVLILQALSANAANPEEE